MSTAGSSPHAPVDFLWIHVLRPVAVGAALATHFETHCPQLPALGAGHLPESEWLLEALSQVHLCSKRITLKETGSESRPAAHLSQAAHPSLSAKRGTQSILFSVQSSIPPSEDSH